MRRYGAATTALTNPAGFVVALRMLNPAANALMSTIACPA
jgi:hypothetical protein